jgi:hypothetical protein
MAPTRPNQGPARQTAAPLQAVAALAVGGRWLRHQAAVGGRQRANGEEPTTMDDLDSAAGATPAMPMNREQSFVEPAGGRRRGRPKGSRNKATLAREDVLEGAAEALVRTLIEQALAGDGAALRFCVAGCCRRGAIARSSSSCRRSRAPAAWPRPRARSSPPAPRAPCRPKKPRRS